MLIKADNLTCQQQASNNDTEHRPPTLGAFANTARVKQEREQRTYRSAETVTKNPAFPDIVMPS
jgi:hypothetical protein